MSTHRSTSPTVPIRTPDQRLRVFVSSTLGELAPERRAVREAVEAFKLTPVMFELGARPHPPQALYRAYLDQSHVFVGLYWQRYGWIAPDMTISGLEDEYRLCEGKPMLIYIKEPSPEREPALGELLSRIEADDRASYRTFGTPAELAGLVADDLAVLLSERFESAASAPAASTERPGRSLPVPPTPLVGRERELEELLAALAVPTTRLVTLTGPGGIGKSRLALAAAELVRDRYDGAVFFVPLASLSDPAHVLPAVAHGVGLQIEGTRPLVDMIGDELGERRLLLVLDNLEHLAGAAGDVARLLAACPNLDVLVTSRTVLRLRGEREFPLEPLDAGTTGVDLFVARAVDANPGFGLTTGNRPAVEEICRRLDGLPLAIELAAARCRLLPPAALLERLGRRLDVLTGGGADLPPHQQTMRSTIDWSYGLLDGPEQAVFAGLGVFAGGWTLGGAEDVVGHLGSDVLDSLSSLVEKSLVCVRDEAGGEAGGEPRFDMLGTIRDYALERLGDDAELTAETGRRHEAHVVALVEAAGPALFEPGNRAVYERLAAEFDNVRAVVRRALDRADPAPVARIAAALWFYWYDGDHVPEVRGWVSEALACGPGVGAAPAAAPLRWIGASLAFQAGDYAEAAALADGCAATFEAAGDDHGAARARMLDGALDVSPAGMDSLAGSLGAFTKLGDRAGQGMTLAFLGSNALALGEIGDAEQYFVELQALSRGTDSDQVTGYAHSNLGYVLTAKGDAAGARGVFREALVSFGRIRNREGTACCLEGLAGTAVSGPDPSPRNAATFLGAASALRETIGVTVWPALTELIDGWADAARAALGREAFERHFEDGAAMSFDEAVAWVRRDAEADGDAGAASG